MTTRPNPTPDRSGWVAAAAVLWALVAGFITITGLIRMWGG